MDLYTVRNKLNLGIPISNINLRVTYYSRVSTDHLEQKTSLNNQNEHFDNMIKSNLNWIYIDGYIDDGISGTNDIKRNSFMRMISDAHENKFDLIVTKEISRFSRNTLDSIKYTRELLNCGVGVLFINDNINTLLPDSELRLTIMASMAQDEIRRLSQRVKFGMNMSIKKGKLLGNDSLYGYKKVNNKLIIIDEEAKNVRFLFNNFIKGVSLNKISNIFKNKNIKTHNGNNFCISTLSRMIKNPKYKGYYCAHKSEVIDYMNKKIKYFNIDNWIMYKDYNKIEPIINEKVWNKANNKLNKRKKINTNKYLFTGKIICKKHNCSFNRRTISKKVVDTIWNCNKYYKEGKNICSVSIRESEIYYILNDMFILDTNNIKNILNDIYNRKILITDNYINNKYYELIIDKIYVNYNIDIELNIKIKYKLNVNNKEFEFNRVKNSKKYVVKYKVNAII